MPTANRLTIHIIAAMAEHEAEMISARTKVTPTAAKDRGGQWNPTAVRITTPLASSRGGFKQIASETHLTQTSSSEIHDLNNHSLR